jgi:hypothetical protein
MSGTGFLKTSAYFLGATVSNPRKDRRNCAGPFNIFVSSGTAGGF